MTVQTAAWGLFGSATTMLTRRATRNALHTEDGRPRLPRVARHNTGLVTVLVLAAAAGVLFALADVLREQQKHAARAEAA